MNKVYIALMLTAIFGVQQVFAHDDDNKSCEAIVNACLDAGFVKEKSEDKGMWKNCMKPLILGKSVDKVKVEESDVKACRSHKIEKTEKELKEFKEVGE